jgi:5-methylcytosine-specific restriction enzyme A
VATSESSRSSSPLEAKPGAGFRLGSAPGNQGWCPVIRYVCAYPGCSNLYEKRHRKQSRCLAHQHVLERSSKERRRRRAAVDAWVEAHGFVCPGSERESHSATDLTADHITPRVLGGEHGELRVLCRGCNGRRGHAIRL